MPPAPRPPLPGLQPLLIRMTPSLCHGCASILFLQRPGRWPPAKLEKGADIILREDGPVWKIWVIHQMVTVNLDGLGGWHTGEKRPYIETLTLLSQVHSGW